MANILLSPIGRSPGAVTGIYYALQRQDPPVLIDKVILLCTAMPQVKESANVVLQDIGRDKVHILALRTQNREQYTVDFDHAEAALDFIMQANAVLDHARRANNRVYIGISGGRSSMGALATLSAYVYGAAGVYHLWVDQEIEDKGDITRLPPRREARKDYLNPAPEKCRLIGLPLTSFDPLWNRDRLDTVLEAHPDAWRSLARAVTDVEQHQVTDVRLNYDGAIDAGIPPHLYLRLMETLQPDPAFDSNAALRALFVDTRLHSWRFELPEANSIAERARQTLAFLWERRNAGEENALALFLQTLRDQTPPTAARHAALTALLAELGIAISPAGAAPAEAEAQNFAVMAARLQAIFKGTELQQPLAQAITLAADNASSGDIIALAEQLKPYIKPRLWDQITLDLRDWESWKRGADRLLKFVETVATPLTVAGLAATLGITLK